MTRLYRLTLALLICWTVWCVTKEICKSWCAGKMIEAGLKFTPVKK